MIDEKGRLFGKINIIDLLVIVVLLVVAVVLAIRLLGRSGYLPSEQKQTSTIEYTVRVTRMDPNSYAEIKRHFDEGDVQFMTNGGIEVSGSVVTDIWSEPYRLSVTLDDGTVVTGQDPYYLDVYFTARSVTSNAETNGVGTQEVRIGRAFIVKTRTYEVNGVVTACDRVDGQ